MEFASIHSPALRTIQSRPSQIRKSAGGECGSIARCTAIALLIKRMKPSRQTPFCATRSTPKIGRQLKNGFGACFSKNLRSSGIFQDYNRSTKRIVLPVFAKSWRRSLALSHRFQRAKSWPMKPMNASSLLKMQAPFIVASCEPSS